MSTDVKSMELSDKKRLVIVELVGGAKKQEAAAAVGVEPETVSRWQRDPEFEAALNLARKDAYEASIQRLRRLQYRALDELEQQFTDVELEPKERRRLALDVLRLTVRLPVPAGRTDAGRIRNDQAWDDMLSFETG